GNLPTRVSPTPGRQACPGAMFRPPTPRPFSAQCQESSGLPENHHSSITAAPQFGKPLHLWKSAPFRPIVISLYPTNGGGAWESNPPTVLFARHAGFEVQEA